RPVAGAGDAFRICRRKFPLGNGQSQNPGPTYQRMVGRQWNGNKNELGEAAGAEPQRSMADLWSLVTLFQYNIAQPGFGLWAGRNHRTGFDLPSLVRPLVEE